MPVRPDLSVFERNRGFNDYQRANEEFQLKKQLAQSQIAEVMKKQNQIDADKLGEQAFLKAAQGMQISPQEAAALKYIDAKSGGIMFDPVTQTVMNKPSILTKAGMALPSVGEQPMAQPSATPKSAPAPSTPSYSNPESDAVIKDIFAPNEANYTPSSPVELTRGGVTPYTNSAMESELAGAVGNPKLQQKIKESYSGQFTPKTIFEQENKLRDEYNNNTKDFRTVQSAYSNIMKTGSTGAGDMSMLYQFVKLLDPNSVVRESEFATAAASGSLGERIQGAAKQIMEGGRLSDDLRAKFLQEAENIYLSQKEGYDRTKQIYGDLAKRSNVNPENVVIEYAKPVKTKSMADKEKLNIDFQVKKAGGKLIGTSGGKRVFEFPDGSHAVEE